jgi:hypothetical protein
MLTLSKALTRFQKEAGADWRNSKFLYAISSIQCSIFQTKSLIQWLLGVNDSLLEIGASLNDEVTNTFARGSNCTIDAYEQHNWVSLKDTENLPATLKESTEFIKQRSQQWFDIRNHFKLTGSKLFEALGIDTLKSLNQHIDKIKNPSKENEPITAEVQARMDHGTKSEINAVATLTGKILPVYFPTLKYIEEGSHVIIHDDVNILVSPDGSIGQIELTDEQNSPSRHIACELKCPFGNQYCTPVHYQLPSR